VKVKGTGIQALLAGTVGAVWIGIPSTLHAYAQLPADSWRSYAVSVCWASAHVDVLVSRNGTWGARRAEAQPVRAVTLGIGLVMGPSSRRHTNRVASKDAGRIDYV
jgi:hypothetical protein